MTVEEQSKKIDLANQIIASIRESLEQIKDAQEKDSEWDKVSRVGETWEN